VFNINYTVNASYRIFHISNFIFPLVRYHDNKASLQPLIGVVV
jgi:hypothetical protein